MRKHNPLDDRNVISMIDKSDMFSLLQQYPAQFENTKKIVGLCTLPRYRPEKVVLAGMGGSKLGGELLARWAADVVAIPIFCIEHFLPRFVDKKTLVIAVSYSGNTEETLEVAHEAFQRKAQLVGVCSGGKLAEFCEKEGVPLIRVPPGIPPRCAIGYLFTSQFLVLSKLGLIHAEHELTDTIETITEIIAKLRPEIQTARNPAKKLALKLFSTMPIIYGYEQYVPVARRWRTQFNENCKILAYDLSFPDCCHNDIVGWNGEMSGTRKSVIVLRDERESPIIQKMIEISKKFAFNRAAQIIEVHAHARTKLGKMFYLLTLGDFTSVYLAILRNVDPTPVEIIAKLKSALSS